MLAFVLGVSPSVFTFTLTGTFARAGPRSAAFESPALAGARLAASRSAFRRSWREGILGAKIEIPPLDLRMILKSPT
jgi:hypothetical protein